MAYIKAIFVIPCKKAKSLWYNSVQIMLTSNTLLYALLSGVLPSLLWLWFWLKEDNLHPEPRLLVLITFLAGMIAVPLVIPFQKIIHVAFADNNTLTLTLWATVEEIFKLLAAVLIALRSKYMDEPIDAMIYLITAALGFAALENTFFILKPLEAGDALQSIITGNLRFVGATLLHVVSSASIGIFIALSFYHGRFMKKFSTLLGIIVATALHTAFNFFIIKSTGSQTFTIFSTVWGAIILLMLLFEKIKTIQPNITHTT
jgi:protease PrsW